MGEKKDCMFQYHNGFRTVEDTDLITLEEALILWDKYRNRFISGLKSGENVEIALWIDCDNNTDYGNSLLWFNSETKYENGRFFELKKEYLDKDLLKLTTK